MRREGATSIAQHERMPLVLCRSHDRNQLIGLASAFQVHHVIH
jgi:hypothetical protein